MTLAFEVIVLNFMAVSKEISTVLISTENYLFVLKYIVTFKIILNSYTVTYCGATNQLICELSRSTSTVCHPCDPWYDLFFLNAINCLFNTTGKMLSGHSCHVKPKTKQAQNCNRQNRGKREAFSII